MNSSFVIISCTATNVKAVMTPTAAIAATVPTGPDAIPTPNIYVDNSPEAQTNAFSIANLVSSVLAVSFAPSTPCNSYALYIESTVFKKSRIVNKASTYGITFFKPFDNSVVVEEKSRIALEIFSFPLNFPSKSFSIRLSKKPSVSSVLPTALR